MNPEIKFSIIVPVFNRPQEMEELLVSLANQTLKNFELVIVEDGSSEKSDFLITRFEQQFKIHYFYKPNSGPGDSRNFGMDKAQAEYLLFFDSDCFIPNDYFQKITHFLNETPLDAFGGPDNADPAFSDVQKAINYAMTSFFTTGGVRGKESKIDKFQPRSFNMGFKKSIYTQLGGFSDIHPGEDPDLSYRIMDAGCKVGLIKDAFVYHKRRIDLEKFSLQVYKFGVVRPILMKWHPAHSQKVYFLPSLFLLACIGMFLISILISKILLLPLSVFVSLLFIDAFMETQNVKIALMAVFASFIQLFSYGWGFMKSYFFVHLLNKEERVVFPNFFFKK